MPEYNCTTSDKQGKVKTEKVHAASEEELSRKILQQQRYLIRIEPVASSAVQSGKTRLTEKSRIEITDTFALLVSSGLSVKDALSIGTDIFTNKKDREFIEGVSERVRRGEGFSQALASEGGGFSSLYIGMVKIGERVGSLEQVFARLAEFLHADKKMKDKIIGALFYPAMVLAVAFLGMLAILLFIFPRIMQIFSSIGNGVPAGMQNAAAGVYIFGGLMLSIALIGIGFFVFLTVLRRTSHPWLIPVDRWLLEVPLLGSFSVKRELLRFCFAMETLVRSGVKVEEAMDEASGVLNNAALKQDVLFAREEVLKGRDLSSALGTQKSVPQRLSRWIAIGEHSGKIETVFGQLRQFYDGEIEKLTSRIMTLIEPALIVLVGVIMMILILTFVLPVFSLFGNLV
ncbi:MAG: type II secretion system F family protein [Spirochaetia bacterium]